MLYPRQFCEPETDEPTVGADGLHLHSSSDSGGLQVSGMVQGQRDLLAVEHDSFLSSCWAADEWMPSKHFRFLLA